MATTFKLSYTRSQKDADIQYLIDRATATVNVLSQLPANYQTLPGIESAAYQTDTNALEADNQALRQHLDAIAALLPELDRKAEGIETRNQAALATLRGLLRGKPEEALLRQISGPRKSKPSSTP
ncbi:hypothetical protein [Armatimonas sp.]|uniref:hypothetical protein n=1 Tax=Armatimonas sp. TaxID=1872638 RepID=UPI00374C9A14